MTRNRTRSLATAALAVFLACGAASAAWATPLDFTLFNPSSSNQSRLDLTAKASLVGGELTSEAQFAPSGLNGQGSMSATYNDTASTDSKLVTNVTQTGIAFPGGSTAVANFAGGGVLGNLNLTPGPGGSGTGPGNYGVRFIAPQDIDIPPIDVPDYGTIDLGILSAIVVNVALRDIVLDVTGTVPLAPPGTLLPQTFDASQLTIGVSGTIDAAVGATLTQPNILSWGAAGLALIALQTALSEQGIDLILTSSFGSLSHTLSFGFTTPLPLTTAINDDATLGTLEHISSNYRLTVPVKFDVVPDLPDGVGEILNLQLGLSGKLIGQTPFTDVDVPEPSSVILAGFGLIAVGAAAVRARRRRS